MFASKEDNLINYTMELQQSSRQNVTGKRQETFRLAFNLAICLIFVMLSLGSLNKEALVEAQEQVNVESRQQKDADELTDTIKYLEKLDKYFSQIARPRFGRSQYKQPVGLMGVPRMQESFGGVDSGASINRPVEFGSLVELINNRLAKKYSETNF